MDSPFTVCRDLIDTMDDATLRGAADHMIEKAMVFDKLRKAMRIALPAGTHGINDRGSNERMSTIAQRVEKFCARVEDAEALSQKQEYKNMIGKIREYWKKLFCDPLTVRTPEGTLRIQPQRTNNILEQLFRSLKWVFRKKSGMNALEKNKRHGNRHGLGKESEQSSVHAHPSRWKAVTGRTICRNRYSAGAKRTQQTLH